MADLAQFLRTQAARRGFGPLSGPKHLHTAGLDALNTGSPGERDTVAHALPDALHHILATFREASSAQRLELLVAYAGALPALPEALQQARDTMEQVDECATPVFLSAQLREGQVHYYIDVPHDAPTMRGFAGLLHTSLNRATPTAIAPPRPTTSASSWASRKPLARCARVRLDGPAPPHEAQCPRLSQSRVRARARRRWLCP